MGQYNVIVNLDKKEFLDPYAFDDGAKAMEFGASGQGTMMALAALLVNSDRRGGGDFNGDGDFMGSWAGDRIVIAGDYATQGDPCEDTLLSSDYENLYTQCKRGLYKNISDDIMYAIRER